jgi:hypothetical protein
MAGGLGAGSQSAAAPRMQAPVRILAASGNEPPLNPGGAAGIRAAQGASDRSVLIASGLILAGIVAALLLIEDDDEDAVSTGTN